MVGMLLWVCWDGFANYNRFGDMDISRGVLDNLMGRDRNKSKNSKNARDHYSNSDVCKPFLICFCFNTLFPNTNFDEGPCNKRHDTYLKVMFDNDLHRGEFEKEAIKECIHWIEKRLVDVEHKTKKNQNVIDTKANFSSDRPKPILDRVMAIDQDIQKMMDQAQTFGDNGQIDDSARCLEEVDRLRERRREIELMGDTMLTGPKQQKVICEICGAIQTINDTEKRIQTHLEGKIHQGFLKLRNEIQSLKIRQEIIQLRENSQKPKEDLPTPEKERPRAPQTHQQRAPTPHKSRSHSNKHKDRSRSRDKKDKHKHKGKDSPKKRDSAHNEKRKDKHRDHSPAKESKKHRRDRSSERDYRRERKQNESR